MCLYPKLIINPKYKSNKKNGGIIPPVSDERAIYVPIGCTNCIECKKQKSRSWRIRLLEDIKTHTNGKFLTLTLSNKSIKELYIELKSKAARGKLQSGYTLDNAIATLATRKFLERYRKHHKKSLRHWLVTELGHKGTENIHLHGIIWTDISLYEIEDIWKYGYTWKGKYVNNKTINYISKYVHKVDQKHKHYKPIILTSPGIGHNYTNDYSSRQNKYKGINTNDTYRTSTGHKVSMPIYWRNKIYNDDEREKLWMQRLDKLERWVCGERVDISKNDKLYFRTLQYYRQKNKELGYGERKIDEEEKQYEQELRKINMQKRIENNNNKK